MNTQFNEQKIIEKIKKLFALSDSPNEKEAAAALNKAQTLLTKYGLEYSDLDGENLNIIEKTILKDSSINLWQLKLIACITTSTYTEALFETDKNIKKIIIIGRKTNVIAAIHLFDYLNTTILKISVKYKIVVRDLESFRLGMVENIKERLDELKQKPAASYENGLIPLIENMYRNENSTYLMDKYGEIGNKENNGSFESNSYGLGKIVGGKISLDSQISKQKE